MWQVLQVEVQPALPLENTGLEVVAPAFSGCTSGSTFKALVSLGYTDSLENID